MLILWLLLFTGVIHCHKDASINGISPNSFDSLSVPCPIQYISIQTLAVQSAYITTVESMLTSKIYIKSGFSELDSLSESPPNNKEDTNGLDEMLQSFKMGQDEEIKEKLNATVYMTAKYYYNKQESVSSTNELLGKAKDVNCAQSQFYARRCESSYNEFIHRKTTLKTKYSTSEGSVNPKNSDVWESTSKRYYEAKQDTVNNNNCVFSAVRDAFMYANRINLCEEAPKIDDNLLGIYDSTDLSSFFNINKNDSMELFRKTTDHMYSLFKASLTVIYLNSACSTSKQMTEMRLMEWEQVNLVRANYELMCEKIVKHIICIQNNAKTKFSENSDDYNKIMQSELYVSVQRMLLTVVKSTEICYRRALKFNVDGSMLVTSSSSTSNNINNMCQINDYYNDVLWRNSKASQYDLRVNDKNNISYPTKQLCIPHDMYSLTINKCFLQSIVVNLNDIILQIQKTPSDHSDATSCIKRLIVIKELENSFTNAKCSATANKIFSLNIATYAYSTLITCDNSRPTDIKPLIDQNNNDVVAVISSESLCVLQTFNLVDNYTSSNTKENIIPREYKPGPLSYSRKGSEEISAESDSYSNPLEFDSSDYTFSYSTNSVTRINIVEITKTLEFFQTSVTTKLSSSISTVQASQQNENTKLVLVALQCSEQQFQCNYKYLDSITLKTINYIEENIPCDTDDYYKALVCVYKDTNEKKLTLSSTMEIPFKRVTDLSSGYTRVEQSVVYTKYVQEMFTYFNINYNDIVNSDKDVDLYVTNCVTKFIQISNDVMEQLKQMKNDNYMEYLLWTLTETIRVCNETGTIFKNQICQSHSILSTMNKNSQDALFVEINQRMETILVLYFPTIVKCHQYVQNCATTNIFISEYEVILTRTTITQYNSTLVITDTTKENKFVSTSETSTSALSERY